MKLNLDSRISDQWNHKEGVDPYGKPIRPEATGRCWYCWGRISLHAAIEKGYRSFCSAAHAHAYYSRSALAAIEEAEKDAAYEAAVDAVMEAEARVREAEAEVDEAEDELRAARDQMRETERASG